MCDECRERAELNPLRAFDCKNDHCREIMAEAPLMVPNQCDECREHYEQVKRAIWMPPVSSMSRIPPGARPGLLHPYRL